MAMQIQVHQMPSSTDQMWEATTVNFNYLCALRNVRCRRKCITGDAAIVPYSSNIFCTYLGIWYTLRQAGFGILGFGLHQCPCSAHAGYIRTYTSLLTGHNALLLRQIAFTCIIK